ncbi:hypothetical protein CGCF415_v000635 [Colletotrichum fructicola]|nr:uncharacterized protein CGMCC3_g3581 [Colletotrichum fructicola]KAE9580766.1 hypothetical protein CGMCC3_g3581 [Colletotrichum fructicola]KAF4894614.1 hypothetical protein CGCFRS4_v006482 [Colletotrichum fructicola]KAF4916771.1 hypothetical protein CGCF415_v000635 [Colletotrichum fructicola]KAF4940379.1 hypothetical protein CGCF245_v002797 [Colletotrichum fructicola]
MLSKQDQSRELQKRQEKERQEAQNRNMDQLAQLVVDTRNATIQEERRRAQERAQRQNRR